jgi:hypothetical protein
MKECQVNHLAPRGEPPGRGAIHRTPGLLSLQPNAGLCLSGFSGFYFPAEFGEGVVLDLPGLLESNAQLFACFVQTFFGLSIQAKPLAKNGSLPRDKFFNHFRNQPAQSFFLQTLARVFGIFFGERFGLPLFCGQEGDAAESD